MSAIENIFNSVLPVLFSTVTSKFFTKFYQGAKEKALEADSVKAMVSTVAPYLILFVICLLLSKNDKYIKGTIDSVDNSTVNSPTKTCPSDGPDKVNKVLDEFVCAKVKIGGSTYGLTVPKNMKQGHTLIFEKVGNDYRIEPGLNDIPFWSWTNWRNIFLKTVIIQVVTFVFSYLFEKFARNKAKDVREKASEIARTTPRPKSVPSVTSGSNESSFSGRQSPLSSKASSSKASSIFGEEQLPPSPKTVKML
jgi:hypothetical protein